LAQRARALGYVPGKGVSKAAAGVNAPLMPSGR
jgi:hypothetical protein